MVRNGVTIFHRSLEKAAAARLLQIPQWMFDARTRYGDAFGANTGDMRRDDTRS
jgi:hypothetical protein